MSFSTVAIPADIAGVIAEYACTGLAEVYPLLQVCSSFDQGISNAEGLWLRLLRQKWPGTKSKNGQKSVMKRRMQAAQQLNQLATPEGKEAFAANIKSETPIKPFDPSTLHPIEDCSLEFHCPYFGENLLKLDEAATKAAQGNPVYDCTVCRDKVYFVSTQEELASCGRDSKCVMLNPALVSQQAYTAENNMRHVLLVDCDGVSAKRELLSLRSADLMRAPSLMNSPKPTFSRGALNGMVMYRRNGPAVQFHFLTLQEGTTCLDDLATDGSGVSADVLQQCSMVFLAGELDLVHRMASVAYSRDSFVNQRQRRTIPFRLR